MWWSCSVIFLEFALNCCHRCCFSGKQLLWRCFPARETAEPHSRQCRRPLKQQWSCEGTQHGTEADDTSVMVDLQCWLHWRHRCIHLDASSTLSVVIQRTQGQFDVAFLSIIITDVQVMSWFVHWTAILILSSGVLVSSCSKSYAWLSSYRAYGHI